MLRVWINSKDSTRETADVVGKEIRSAQKDELEIPVLGATHFQDGQVSLKLT